MYIICTLNEFLIKWIMIWCLIFRYKSWDLKSLIVRSLGDVTFPCFVQKLLLLMTRLDLQHKDIKTISSLGPTDKLHAVKSSNFFAILRIKYIFHKRKHWHGFDFQHHNNNNNDNKKESSFCFVKSKIISFLANGWTKLPAPPCTWTPPCWFPPSSVAPACSLALPQHSSLCPLKSYR